VLKESPRRLKRLLRIKFELGTLRKTPKLMWTLDELRCEGVEFNALEFVFCKYILVRLRLHTFCEMECIFCQYPSRYWYLLYCICSRALFGFLSKAEAQRPMVGQVVPAHMDALPLILAPPAKKGKRGAKAPRKAGAARAPRSASVRGHARRSAKVVAD
jgi:hypothetical protein